MAKEAKAADAESPEEEGKQRPMKSFRCGLVNAAVFENVISRNGRTSALRSVSLQRRYENAKGVWKSTASFSGAEVLAAIHVLERAQRFIESLEEHEPE